MMMAVFAYIYHQSFVVSQGFPVEMILDQVLLLLSIPLGGCVHLMDDKLMHFESDIKPPD